ncbi:multidrug efflux MFS transporter MdtH [Silvimonas soli]|uniref:multidrug efflux MFS transporter MdtH n=1 Tax=Silvimonas soli TaxID=2980100 RepID=UPI0024B391AC|nr:multidrug efflux MFS transporter MdtH [Silvimonas soli]
MSLPSKARRQGKLFILLDNFLVVFGFFVVFPLISIHFVDHMGWAAILVGTALAVRQFIQQGLGIFGGAVADRFGAKPMIVTGMLMRAAGFALMALATTPLVLILSCVLSALGGVLFDPPRSALIIKLTRPRERNRFYAIIMMQDSAGAVLGAMTGSWLLNVGFEWVGWMGAALFVTCALCNALLLPNYRIARGRSAFFANIGKVLADREYVKYALTLSGYYALAVQVLMLMPIAVMQLTHDSHAVGWMYTLETALSLTLLYPIAHFAEHRVRLESRLLIGLALMCVSLFLQAFSQSLTVFFVLLAGFYIGTITADPAREMLSARKADSAMLGSYMGFSRIGLALGGALGQLFAGAAYDLSRQWHTPKLPWFALSGIGVITWLGLWKLLKPVRGHSSATVRTQRA